MAVQCLQNRGLKHTVPIFHMLPVTVAELVVRHHVGVLQGGPGHDVPVPDGRWGSYVLCALTPPLPGEPVCRTRVWHRGGGRRAGGKAGDAESVHDADAVHLVRL